MSEPLIIFQAVQSDKEKQAFLEKVIAQQDPIYLRDKADNPLVVKPTSRGPGLSLQCLPVHSPGLIPNKLGRSTIHVSLENETYYFDTIPEFSGQFIKLPLLNLFHLQKRKNFRLTIPENYKAHFVFSTLNKKQNQVVCRLIDINTDGCALEAELHSAHFKVQDQFEGAIYLGHRSPLIVQGFIKNIREKENEDLILGIQFKHLPNANEGLIVSALTDLQREFYFKKSG